MVTCNTTVSKRIGNLGFVVCLFLHRYSHNAEQIHTSKLKHIQMVSDPHVTIQEVGSCFPHRQIDR